MEGRWSSGSADEDDMFFLSPVRSPARMVMGPFRQAAPRMTRTNAPTFISVDKRRLAHVDGVIRLQALYIRFNLTMQLNSIKEARLGDSIIYSLWANNPVSITTITTGSGSHHRLS